MKDPYPGDYTPYPGPELDRIGSMVGHNVAQDTQKSVKDTQIGGEHYLKGIQPRDYARSHGFGYEEVLALRYLTRHRQKNGRQDLEKAIHCLQLLIEAEYGHGSNSR